MSKAKRRTIEILVDRLREHLDHINAAAGEEEENDERFFAGDVAYLHGLSVEVGAPVRVDSP